MNLMFRKNFREGASKSGGGGGKLQSKANRTKRSRDMGLVQQPEEIHYRTHLFFSPNRPGYDVGEGKLSLALQHQHQQQKQHKQQQQQQSKSKYSTQSKEWTTKAYITLHLKYKKNNN